MKTKIDSTIPLKNLQAMKASWGANHPGVIAMEKGFKYMEEFKGKVRQMEEIKAKVGKSDFTTKQVIQAGRVVNIVSFAQKSKYTMYNMMAEINKKSAK